MQQQCIANILLLLCGFVFLNGGLSAQSLSLCSKLPFTFSCEINFSDPLLEDDKIVVEKAVQYSRNVNIGDISYLNDNPLFSDCGTVTPFSCRAEKPLVYDVFYPDDQNAYPCYRNKPLPAVILFHGGGFSDCSDYGGSLGVEYYCREFAKRGFVAFNVEYRSGRLRDTQYLPNNAGNYFSASNLLATYRAIQDGRGVLRSIIEKNTTSLNQPFRIDTDNIFVGGISSGAILAMGIAYYTSEMLNEVFGDVNKVLGPPDIDLYTGGLSTRYKIKGVMNLWGGVYMPPDYMGSPAAFFGKNKYPDGSNRNVPMIAFQGNEDNVVPVYKANIFYSASKNFRTANTCSVSGPASFTVPDNDASSPVKDLIMFGTNGFYEVLKDKTGIPSELYLDSDMRHGLDKNANFGTSIDVGTRGTGIIPYIVERAATFFQAIGNGLAQQLDETIFFDCENYRHGCSVKNNHALCGTASSGEATSLVREQLNNAAAFQCDIKQLNRSLHVNFNTTVKAMITLFDIYGNPVKKMNISDTNQGVLICNGLPQGIYFLKVISGNHIQTKKISLM